MTDGTGHDEELTAPIPAATVSEPAATPEPDPEPTPDPAVSPVAAAGAAAVGSTNLAKRVWLNRDSAWFWPLAGLVGYLLVLLFTFLANWIPFNDQKSTDVLFKQALPFQPASWTFFIWILIDILLGVYVVYTLTPGGQRSHRVRRVGGFFLISCAATIAWLFLWHWDQYLLSLIAILVLWASLLVIYILARSGNIDGRQPTTWQKIAIQLPFSVYIGWASFATLTVFAVWASRSWHSGNPFSDRSWAIVLMVIGTVLAAAFALFARDPIVPLVFVWGFFGIIQQQWNHSTLVVVIAVVAAIACAALTVAAWSLRFNPDALADITSRRRRTAPAEVSDQPPTP
ncbi:MAG: TspO/MBR family protein [Thermomicrobiales bacterium]